MDNATIAVTGISGMLGQRLLPLLDASPSVARIVGLDVREPTRRAGKLEFHRVDVSVSELEPLLGGVDTLVHLASLRDPLDDARLSERVNVAGTRRLLDAARSVGVTRVVRLSSATVYGAWEDNPVPLTEDATLRPNAGYLPALFDCECERRLGAWRGESDSRRAVTLRCAPIVGPGSVSVLASAALGQPPVRTRDNRRPIQVVHVDDMASAVLHVLEHDLDGVFNVAADSFLESDEAAALVGGSRLPALPAEIARQVLAIGWASGLGDAPPSILPYLMYSWVVANDRLKATGWRARHSNDEAILLSVEPSRRSTVGWVAAATAITAGAALGTILMRRRLRRRRASRPSRR